MSVSGKGLKSIGGNSPPSPVAPPLAGTVVVVDVVDVVEVVVDVVEVLVVDQRPLFTMVIDGCAIVVVVLGFFFFFGVLDVVLGMLVDVEIEVGNDVLVDVVVEDESDVGVTFLSTTAGRSAATLFEMEVGTLPRGPSISSNCAPSMFRKKSSSLVERVESQGFVPPRVGPAKPFVRAVRIGQVVALDEVSSSMKS